MRQILMINKGLHSAPQPQGAEFGAVGERKTAITSSPNGDEWRNHPITLFNPEENVFPDGRWIFHQLNSPQHIRILPADEKAA
jgi:hypothetical protein